MKKALASTLWEGLALLDDAVLHTVFLDSMTKPEMELREQDIQHRWWRSFFCLRSNTYDAVD